MQYGKKAVRNTGYLQQLSMICINQRIDCRETAVFGSLFYVSMYYKFLFAVDSISLIRFN